MQRSKGSTVLRRPCPSGRRSISPMARSGWKESGMKVFRWLVSSAGAWALLLPLTAQPPTVIKVNVNLVHAVVTVKNQEGQLVGNLQKGDFEVYDNGVKQEIALFEHHTEQ